MQIKSTSHRKAWVRIHLGDRHSASQRRRSSVRVSMGVGCVLELGTACFQSGAGAGVLGALIGLGRRGATGPRRCHEAGKGLNQRRAAHQSAGHERQRSHGCREWPGSARRSLRVRASASGGDTPREASEWAGASTLVLLRGSRMLRVSNSGRRSVQGSARATSSPVMMVAGCSRTISKLLNDSAGWSEVSFERPATSSPAACV